MDRTLSRVLICTPLGLSVAVFWVPIPVMAVIRTLFCGPYVSAWLVKLIGESTRENNGGHDVCSQGVGLEYKFKPSDITGGCLALT